VELESAVARKGNIFCLAYHGFGLLNAGAVFFRRIAILDYDGAD